MFKSRTTFNTREILSFAFADWTDDVFLTSEILSFAFRSTEVAQNPTFVWQKFVSQ